MATHLSFEADLKAAPAGQNTSKLHSASQRSVNRKPEKINSFAVDSDRGTPASPASRVITREQGCALEMIGHAVDYLNDCYVNEGPDEEILDFSSPSLDAVRILISAQRQILQSLPVAEPLTVRFWNAVWRRQSKTQSAGVVPLSSSR